MTKRIVIKNGTVTGFADDVEKLGIKMVGANSKRVSVILPQNRVLRLLFTKVRAHVSDNSLVASLSRLVPCNWMVIIDDTEHGPYKSRKAAIAFEKQYIFDQGKLHNDIANINEVTHG